ncbi:unnamed protein product, partial [marine sediment metagenome]
ELTATIDPKEYTDIDALALAIKAAMKAVSANDYAVSYDSTNSKFIIRADGTNLNELNELHLLWGTGKNANAGTSAAATLGFNKADDIVTFPISDNQVTLITIDNTNNKIDFEEVSAGVNSGELTATIAGGDYTDLVALESAIETAMEARTLYDIDYAVSYNSTTGKFTIEEDGGAPVLTELQLLWKSGTNKGSNAAVTIGFNDSVDETGVTSYAGDNKVVLITIDDTNNKLDFSEVNAAGLNSSELTATIAGGDYT